MAKRLIVPPGLLVSGACSFPEDLCHYVHRVLRIQAGASLLLHDGEGGVASAEVLEVTKRGVRVQIGPVNRAPRDGPQIELLQAVGKGDKMDHVVRQATELGACRVAPVLTARAVARQEKRVDRWRTIAEDAVRVAGHRYRPQIDEVCSLQSALASVHAGTRLVLALEGANPLKDVLQAASPQDDIALLIGPEGGLTAEEVCEAQASGFVAVHLGANTLRTETAGPAAVAILSFWAGGFA